MERKSNHNSSLSISSIPQRSKNVSKDRGALGLHLPSINASEKAYKSPYNKNQNSLKMYGKSKYALGRHKYS
jgi:hypothetical protein